MGRNNWLDGMMGLIVGDALGVPVQFLSREEIAKGGAVVGMESGGVYNTPAGTWSDDSSMALATLDSIIDKRSCNAMDIMMRFIQWEYDGAYTPFGRAFDEGGTCVAAIHNYMRNPNIFTCGLRDVRSNGNGSLMRILPACLYYISGQRRNDLTNRQAVSGIHVISGLTHNHLRSKTCCTLYYFMAKSVLDGSGGLLERLQAGIDTGLAMYREKLCNMELAYLKRLFCLCEFKNVPERQIRSTGYVVDTYEAAVWCLITTKSYKDCMLKAVNLGDDADTVAAVAGGLAGLYYGYESIPEEWLAVIKRREWIEGLCNAARRIFDVDKNACGA